MTGSKRKGISKKAATQDSYEGENPAAHMVAIPKEPQPAPPKPKLERIGDILRQARQERGDDLYQIAEYLCIKPSFLIALENSRYDEFPADAYVIGFLRTYANFLGVDGKDAVDRYRYEMAGRRRKPVLAMPVPVAEGKAPSGIIMVGATIAAMLVYALWYGVSSNNRTEVTTPPPLPTAAVQPVATPAADATVAAGLTAPMGSTASSTATAQVAGMPPESPGIMLSSAAPAAKPEETSAAKDADKTDKKADIKTTKDDDTAKKDDAKKDDGKKDDTAAKDDKKDDKNVKAQVYGDPNAVARLIIKATQSSWIMVTDDSGKTVFDKVLKPGDTYKVPNKDGLSLTTGNGAGISLILDGGELPKVATGAPHVVRNISLDPDRLSGDQ